jgi:hypothetical protein
MEVAVSMVLCGFYKVKTTSIKNGTGAIFYAGGVCIPA